MFVADDRGTEAWEFRGGKLTRMWTNENHGTSPIVAGGLLYIYDPRGSLRVYEPESGRQVAELDCGPGHWNSPTVIDGKIALPEGNEPPQHERHSQYLAGEEQVRFIFDFRFLIFDCPRSHPSKPARVGRRRMPNS